MLVLLADDDGIALLCILDNFVLPVVDEDFVVEYDILDVDDVDVDVDVDDDVDDKDDFDTNIDNDDVDCWSNALFVLFI